MKMLTALATVIFLPNIAYSQENSHDDFDLLGNAYTKYIALTNEPDLTLSDYRGYEEYPFVEVGANLDLSLMYNFSLEAHPYFWASEENKISRVGLEGKVKYEAWHDTSGILDYQLEFGWHHHSWHNVDKDGKSRTQDSLFVSLGFINNRLGKKLEQNMKVSFAFEPHVFVNNNDPNIVKDLYNGDEDDAFAGFYLPVSVECDKWIFELEPYSFFASDSVQFGGYGLAGYNLTENITIFADAEWYDSTGRDSTPTHSLGLGLMIWFD